MPGIADELTRVLRQQVTTRMGRAGYSPLGLGELQREVLWWIWARMEAVRSVRPLVGGQAIAWGSNGYAQLVPTEVPVAGRGQVTVLVEASAVSPGTERAQYLRLPDAPVGLLGRPGYSAAGVVVRVGPGVSDVKAGHRVAVTGAAHASVVTVAAEAVYRIPEGVSPVAAALTELGIIARYGVRRSGLAAGQSFCVVGAGLVGALALRTAAAMGGDPLAFVARSDHKQDIAKAGGARSFLVTGRDDAAIAELGASVVIESTGDPGGLAVALTAAGDGGRIVVLGSPRGTTPHVPIETIGARRLEIVGAHVATLGAGGTSPAREGGDVRRHEGEAFLAAVADGEVSVSDLTGPAIDPREAAVFYRRLAAARDVVGAHFDWTRLPEGDRIGAAHLLAPPDVAVRGVEPEHRPLRLARSVRRGPLRLDDPFVGATGRLRIGMLGCGDIAVRNGAAIAAAPNVELAACYDPQQRLAEDLARSFGGRAAASAEELVRHEGVDAVLISVPHHLHAPLAEEAMAAGRHVIVEKPLADSLPAAARIVKAAEDAGVVLSVCFPQRFEPEVVLAKRLIDDGALGPFCGSAARLYLDKTPAYWQGGFSGRSRSDWRGSRERAGGGVLIMNLSHHIDLVRHLAGAEIETVTAVAGVTDEQREVEDSISVGVTFAGGAVGSFTGWAAVRGSDSAELRVWGQDGHVVLEPAPRIYTLRAIDGLRTGRWQVLTARGGVDSRAVYLSRLATAIDQGRPVDIPGRDGLAVQAVIEAGYRAAAKGEVVGPAALLAEAGQ